MLQLFKLLGDIHVVECDIRTADLLAEIVAADRLEYAFHLAAQAPFSGVWC